MPLQCHVYTAQLIIMQNNKQVVDYELKIRVLRAHSGHKTFDRK